MIETWCPTLKKGGNDDNAQLTGQFAIELCRRTGDGFCEVEVIDIFGLAEVERVVQLLKDDEFGTPLCEVSDTVGQVPDILRYVS
jgi:hypothetical protein